jgi:hypothetical protein
MSESRLHGGEPMIRAKAYIFAAAMLLFLLLTVTIISAQQVTIREHKKVPVTSKTRLLIVRHSGESLKGNWQMETSDAICLKTKYGREVIVPKLEISEIYRCDRQTDVGFFYGFLIGFTTPFFVAGLSDTPLEDVYVPAPVIGAGCGFVGAIIGSFIDSYEPVDADNLSFGVVTGDFEQGTGIRFQFRYTF